MLQKIAHTIRHLTMDAVELAGSGHTGMPMGCAELGAYLFGEFLRFDPAYPKWPHRDRLILSVGHGSLWLYSCLHLSGFPLTLDDLKNFRQIDSKTPSLGPVDHSNLYQYVFNNPFLYRNPYGESIGGYLFGLGEIILGGTIMAGGFALEVVTVGGFTCGLGLTPSIGAALIGLGLTTTTYHAQDIKIPNISWKNTDVYVPDRPLPNNPVGIHVPDVDAPHTQLGTKEGRHGKYPQAG